MIKRILTDSFDTAVLILIRVEGQRVPLRNDAGYGDTSISRGF